MAGHRLTSVVPAEALGSCIFGRARRNRPSDDGRRIVLDLDAFGPRASGRRRRIRSASAASPPRSVPNVIRADAGVGLARGTFRTELRLVPIPTVATSAPHAPAVWVLHLCRRACVTHTRARWRARKFRDAAGGRRWCTPTSAPLSPGSWRPRERCRRKPRSVGGRSASPRSRLDLACRVS
jgi:hypothetical protein